MRKADFFAWEKTEANRKNDGTEAHFFLVRLSILLALAGRPHFCFIANALVDLAIAKVVSIDRDIAVSLSGYFL